MRGPFAVSLFVGFPERLGRAARPWISSRTLLRGGLLVDAEAEEALPGRWIGRYVVTWAGPAGKNWVSDVSHDAKSVDQRQKKKLLARALRERRSVGVEAWSDAYRQGLMLWADAGKGVGHGAGAVVPGMAARMPWTAPAALRKWSASLQNVWSEWQSSSVSPAGRCV